MGANGSGKSTLLGALAGLVPLQSGSLERSDATRIALLQQDADNQLLATSVRNELELSIPVEVAAGARAARIEAAIERFDLAHLLDRNPHRLSGGEKQRLACATVQLETPDLLLLDEPLSFLDPDARNRVIDFVRETNARGVAVVWATPGDDAPLARDVVCLDRGRMVDATSVATIAASPAKPAKPRELGQVAVSVEHASFAYDGRSVLDSIDLEVSSGECVGVVGRNGAGKSTLLALMGGAVAPVSGRVVRAPRDGTGALYLPQSPERMFFAETVREEVAFGLKRVRRVARHASVDEIARASLHAVGLDAADMLERSPFQLSFGEMRRLAFAIVHAMAPALLLLDEPASCLDRAGRAVLAALVASRLDAGAAVVIASHNPEHLRSLCDRVVVLEGGRVR